MKSLLVILFVAQSMVFASAFAKSAPGKKKSDGAKILCTKFQAKEDDECAHIVCDDDIAAGTWKDLDDCTSAEDYAEAAQGACDGQENTVESQVKAYNKKHPSKPIKCD